MAKLETRTDDIMDNIPYYEKWQRGEGIPTIKTFFIQDLKEVPLSPCDRIGGDGVFINMEGAGQATGATICEIAPGKSLKPQRQLYEELLLVIKGRGATTVWNNKGAKQTFEWQEGSLLSIPLNVWHQHFNGQGDEPARFFSVNNMPIIFSLFHNPEFIFNTPYDFTDRFNGEPQYFSGKGISHPGRIWETNFIANAYEFKLDPHSDPRSEKVSGGLGGNFHMSGGWPSGHFAQWGVGIYHQAHRPVPGSVITGLNGTGYGCAWPRPVTCTP